MFYFDTDYLQTLWRSCFQVQAISKLLHGESVSLGYALALLAFEQLCGREDYP